MTTDRATESDRAAEAGTGSDSKESNIDSSHLDMWKVNCTPTVESNIILVGGGHSSAQIIPHICRTMRGGIRGVVFIDHEAGEIGRLQEKMNALQVPTAFIGLENTVERDRRAFDAHARQLGMNSSRVNYGAEIHDRPAVIRNHVWLRRQDIFTPIWNYMRQMGREIEGRVIFVFGMTGMTSATVALEAAECIRNLTRERFVLPDGTRVTSHDAVEPKQLGIGLFPADPTLGADTWNIHHGLNVARVIESRMQETVSGEDAQDSGDQKTAIFDSYTCLDASGDAIHHMEPHDFADWVSRTLALIFTGMTSSSEWVIADRQEILSSLERSTNLSLVMGGVERGRDQQQVQVIKDIKAVESDTANYFDQSLKRIQEVQKRIYDGGELRDGDVDALSDASRVPDRFLRALNTVEELGEMEGDVVVLRQAETELNKAAQNAKSSSEDLKHVQEARSSRRPSLKAPVLGLVIGAIIGATLGYISGFVGSIIGGVTLGLLGVLVGLAISRKNARLRHNQEALQKQRTFHDALEELQDATGRLVSAMNAAELSDSAVKLLHADWDRRHFTRLWAMPMPAKPFLEFGDASLPLSSNDPGEENPDPDRQIERASARRRLANRVKDLLVYAVSPLLGASPLRVNRLRLLVSGPSGVAEDFQLGEIGGRGGSVAMQELFGENLGYQERDSSGRIGKQTFWEHVMGRVLPDDYPCYMLMQWEYKDEKYTPRYYKFIDRRIDVKELPDDRNAWPDVPTVESAVDEANRLLRSQGD